jgi:hypothetical protein
MESTRRAALVTGVLFVVTFITSIGALVFYAPLLGDPNYVVGAGADSQVFLGALLEVLLAIANIGTAVTLFPILKRENRAMALGYVASRTVESTMILVGVISLLSLVTLRQKLGGAAGADAALVIVGRALVAIHDWTFVMGPGFCVAVNDLLLGYLLYRTALVPRALTVLGIVGGPVLFVAQTAQMFGVIQPFSTWTGIATVPVFVFELGFGLWLIARGFSPGAISALMARHGEAGEDSPSYRR